MVSAPLMDTLDMPEITTKSVRDTEIVARLAAGENSISIAKDYDINDRRVRQIREDNKLLVQYTNQNLIAKTLSDASDIIVADVKTVKRIALKANENIEKVTENEMDYKKAHNYVPKDILKSTGIFASQSSYAVTNIFQDNSTTNQVITTDMQNFLDFKANKGAEMLIEGVDNPQITTIDRGNGEQT